MEGTQKQEAKWNMRMNETENFGIFKEISGYLESLLAICTKLQLETLLVIFTIENPRANCLHVRKSTVCLCRMYIIWQIDYTFARISI